MFKQNSLCKSNPYDWNELQNLFPGGDVNHIASYLIQNNVLIFSVYDK